MLVGSSDQFRIDVHAATVFVETHTTFDERKNGVIFSETNTFACEELRAALTDNNVSGEHVLATELLYAKTFADAVTSVFD